MTDVALPFNGLQLALDLERAGAITPTSLDLTEKISLDRCEALGRFFGSVKRSCSWWIGDLDIFGEATHGEHYAQVMASTGLAQETLSHYRYVCERVPRSRRRPALSFGAHAAVAALPPAEQKRWLDKAEHDGLTSAELRHLIADAGREARGEQGTIEGTERSPRIDTTAVIEVGRAILRDARILDDGDALVPAETFARLKAAYGIEE